MSLLIIFFNRTDINGDHKRCDKVEREKKKLIPFQMIHEGANAVGGFNRRLCHVVIKFDDHKSTLMKKVFHFHLS